MSENVGSDAAEPPNPFPAWPNGLGRMLHSHVREILHNTVADHCAPEQVAIASLRFGDSPRLRGEDPSHTLQLAEAGDVLPPIVVQRDTHEVIDGLHRVYAALMNGRDTLQAYYFDGSSDEAFVVAVALNVGHGLALPLPDRRAAASRIMRMYPHWSDRAVAQATGLSATTIAAIRRSTAQSGQLNMRLGRDGRVRPLSTVSGRQTAADYLIAHPESSLRTVARVAGISPTTVRDVRNRLASGQSPVPASQDGEHECSESTNIERQQTCPVNQAALSQALPLLRTLMGDPSVRMSDAGRTMLRWLHSHAVDDADIDLLVRTAPAHHMSMLAEFADTCAHNWSVLSRAFRQCDQHD